MSPLRPAREVERTPEFAARERGSKASEGQYRGKLKKQALLGLLLERERDPRGKGDFCRKVQKQAVCAPHHVVQENKSIAWLSSVRLYQQLTETDADRYLWPTTGLRSEIPMEELGKGA